MTLKDKEEVLKHLSELWASKISERSEINAQLTHIQETIKLIKKSPTTK